MTDAAGTCEVSYPGIPNKDGNILFRVDGAEFSAGEVTYAYDPASNHDPDGNAEANATAIRVWW